jgi:hypothetical protein
MTFLKTVSAVVAAVALVPASAGAQHRGGGHARSGGGHAGASGVAVPRSAGAPRGVAGPRVYGSARATGVAPRSYIYGGRPVYAQRRYGTVGRAVPRGVGAYPYRYYRPYYPYRFYRPYYSFRPYFSVGLGLWVGYPFAYYGYYAPFYPYAYPYSYPYAYPYPYQYQYPYSGYADPYATGGYPTYSQPPPPPPPSSSVGVQQGQANSGGVSFEITPSDAELYVDGARVGTVSDYSPTTAPLGLSPGRHQIEIRAPGYRTMAFDVDIVAGQVIPYRGALQR